MAPAQAQVNGNQSPYSYNTSCPPASPDNLRFFHNDATERNRRGSAHQSLGWRASREERDNFQQILVGLSYRYYIPFSR